MERKRNIERAPHRSQSALAVSGSRKFSIFGTMCEAKDITSSAPVMNGGVGSGIISMRTAYAYANLGPQSQPSLTARTGRQHWRRLRQPPWPAHVCCRLRPRLCPSVSPRTHAARLE